MVVISTAEHSDFVSGQYCAAGRGSSYVPGVGHGMPERWSWRPTSIGLIQYHTTALHPQIASQERAAPEMVYEDTRQASTSATAKSFVISTSVVAAQEIGKGCPRMFESAERSRWGVGNCATTTAVSVILGSAACAMAAHVFTWPERSALGLSMYAVWRFPSHNLYQTRQDRELRNRCADR